MKNCNHKTVNCKLLVIIPAYNAGKYLASTLKSLLKQSFSEFRVVIADDASTDDTVAVASGFIHKFAGRLSILSYNANAGTYRTMNKAIAHELKDPSWQFFTISGADDSSAPDRFDKQMAAFSDSLYGVGCAWQKVDAKTKKKLFQRRSGSSVYIFRRQLIDISGFYDSVRYGADTEYLYRAIRKLGAQAFIDLPEVLATAWETGNGLTSGYKGGSAFPGARQVYVNTFQIDHAKGKLYRHHIHKPIIATMATMAGREASAAATIESIIPQVDHLYVWANPGSNLSCSNPKVTVHHGDADLGDVGKFAFDQLLPDCYRITIDDDLIYPYDFVSRTINNVIHYKAVISYHGKIYDHSRPDKSYYKDIKTAVACLKHYPSDIRVDCGGTGVMGYDIAMIRYNHHDFLHINMADTWVGKFCHERSIPIMALAHLPEWIKVGADFADCIYNHLHDKDTIQTQILNSFICPLASEPVIVGMASFPARVNALRESVASILPQCDELCIYLNDYDHVPDYLIHDKITVFQSQHHQGDIGDVGKFYAVAGRSGYIFLADDKIIYPADYVRETIQNIEKHKRLAVVTYHGRQLSPSKPCTSYYRDYYRICDFQRHHSADTPLHIGGTGVMAFHSSLLDIDLAVFTKTNMSDIFFAEHCLMNNIPIIGLKHTARYFRVSRLFDPSVSICRTFAYNDQFQTQYINAIPWPHPPISVETRHALSHI